MIQKLLNMSHCTANPKQNLQNDLCLLGRLRSDYAVRVDWPTSFFLKKHWDLDQHCSPDMSSGKTAQRRRLMSFCWVTDFCCRPARSPRPASPHFSHFQLFNGSCWSRLGSSLIILLAHLSRRLMGELIVKPGIRRPSSSVRRPRRRRPSTFSNDISSEAKKPILAIFHI